jgi:MFS family permease
MPAAPMTGSIKLKLSLMMFLQFFIWGAWFELGFDYIPWLDFSTIQTALIIGAFNVGAVFALFFSTQFADRNFAAEKFLAFSHLVGGLAILGLYLLHPDDETVKAAESAKAAALKLVPASEASTVHVPKVAFWPFFLCMLVHSLFYVPTISITNSIAFAAMNDPARQFGPIRVWGTIGWIAASWPFIFILADWTAINAKGKMGLIDTLKAALGTSLEGNELRTGQSYIFLVAGVASIVLAMFSLTLPHTPPKPGESLAWLKAVRLLRHPFVLVLFMVTFIDAAVHQSFFYWTASFLGPIANGGVVDIPSNLVTPVMKIGQIAEIITMLFLGSVLKTFGWRITMIVGVLGHAARFAVFAFLPDNPTAVIAINVIHGICYAFFFATVYIFIDEYFPKDIRSSAQGLFNMLILGIGPFLANLVCGELGEKYSPGKNHDYQPVFMVSLYAAAAGAAALLLFFHPPRINEFARER